ncbi:MAG TPA: chromate transporter [Clostridiales bacterium]|nr:chromate transporter [Clostridiales bacterium]
MEALVKLFFAFMKIGAFSFGGGLAMLPLIEQEVVDVHHWLTPYEFVDIVAISEMTPGPISINTSTFVGYRTAGIFGAAAASIGVVIVSFFLVLILARRFTRIKDKPATKLVFQGIRPATLGLVMSAAISMGKTSFLDLKSVLIAGIILFLLLKKKMNPILGIVLAAALGILFY